MRTEIKKWGINGEGIAYYKRKPVFIDGVIPGEMVDFHIVEEKNKYCIGEVDRIIERSGRRRYPVCAKWRECGGCALMHVQYKEQCKMKGLAVSEALRKYAHTMKRPLPIVKNPEPLAYRNSCKLPLHRVHGIWLSGMYEKGSNHFIGIDRCYVHSKVLEQTRQVLMSIMTEFRLEGFKTLVMKEFERKIQIIFVTEDIRIPCDFIEKVMELESVVSVWQSVKMDGSIDVFGETMVHLGGIEAMHVHLGDVDCALLPRAFFQLNTSQAMNLYTIVKDWVPKSRIIAEAYCGIGAISLFVKDKAEKVIGIESNAVAVKNAKENARKNHCDHVDFICGDAAQELKKLNNVNTLIVDPPRSGLNEDMKDVILASDIHTLIYVSCNPSTLGKDLGVLQKKYRIQKIQPVDMFSQTPVVETVCLLSRQK